MVFLVKVLDLDSIWVIVLGFNLEISIFLWVFNRFLIGFVFFVFEIIFIKIDKKILFWFCDFIFEKKNGIFI